MMGAEQNNESSGTNATAIVKAPLLANSRGLVLRDFDQMWRFACCVQRSGLAQKGQDRPEQIIIKLQTGLEIGLQPMQSLQGIAVINNKATIMGDTALGLILKSGLLEDKQEFYEGDFEKDNYKAVFITKRKGDTEAKRTEFSKADARVAKLWGKRGEKGQDTPWITYPQRMLMYRAKGFHFRDYWPDVLKGLHLYEEFVGHVELADGAAELPSREERAALPQEAQAEAPTEASGPIAEVAAKMRALLLDGVGPNQEELITPALIETALLDLAARLLDSDAEPLKDGDAWTAELAAKCVKELETSGLDPRWLPGIRDGVPETVGQQKLPGTE